MMGRNLITVYEALRSAGFVRSKRDFATRWLGRGKTYMRDYEYKVGRDGTRVSPGTVARLRRLLTEIAARSSVAVKADLSKIILDIDRDCRVVEMLRRR